MKRRQLNDRIILVAGGSGGIGRETCRRLASAGATLAIVSTNEERLQMVLREVEKESPGSIGLAADLTLLSEWLRVTGAIVKHLGRIDALVNCVGALLPRPIDTIEESEIRKIIGTNLDSMIFGVRAVLPLMRKRQSGHIVHVGSLGGIIPMPSDSVYSAVKFAVRGLTLSLSQELKGTGINVSHIAPCAVRTRMLEVEGLGGASTITFAHSPVDPARVANAIVKVLLRPKREVVIPQLGSALSVVLGLFPRFFAMSYPFLQALGRSRRKQYTLRYLSHLPL